MIMDSTMGLACIAAADFTDFTLGTYQVHVRANPP